jgi:dipeptidyl aminopeptidase/acylaminoacyl peptidase
MTPVITAERAVFDLPVLANARVSPDGKRVTYTRTVVDRATGKYDSQIWLYEFESGDKRQLTRTGSANGEAIWSIDGKSIAFVAEREGDKPHTISLLALTGGEARILTRHTKRPGGLVFSPDGKTIAYTVQVDPGNPDETPVDPKAPKAVRATRRIDYKQDGFGYLNDVRQQIFVVDVESGERRQITNEAVDHVRPNWSPDGARLVAILPNRNGILSRCGVIDIETGATEAFGAVDGEVGLAAFSPDGGRIFVSADDHGGPHLSGYLIDLDSKSFAKVLDDPEFLIDSSSTSTSFPAWLDAQSVLLGGQLGGRSGLWTVDLATGTASQLGIWESVHGGLSLPDDHSFTVHTAGTLGGFVGLVRVDLESGERTVLFNEAEEFFAEVPPASWEKCPFDRDGVTIDAWLIKPSDFDPAKTYPLIIDIHGGPHGAYGYTSNLVAEVLASHGYLVILANPRGSVTYGSAYANAVKGDWGGVDWADLEAVLDSVVSRPYADAGRTGAYGYSYGGYMTSWILGQTNRFKAVVCGAPVFDLESFFGTSDIGHVFGVEQQGGAPWEIRDHVFERSPSSHIHKATTPTLIVHGEADERCPIGQGEQMFISLLKAGCEAEFVRYPGGYHGFVSTGEPAHRVDYLDRVVAWFDTYLADGSK